MAPSTARPRVLVVGGGFGGLRVAQSLADAPVDVLLVDRRNHHLFQPLLYQVATAGLSPADIARPIRSVLRGQENATVLLDTVENVDLQGQRVLLTGQGEVAFDWLVLAAGAGHAYFGHDDWAEHAPGLKTVEDALDIRRRVLLAYEAAEYEDDPAQRRQKLTFVVVGGGPTGVEMAGALREVASESIPADFRRVDTTTARVIVVEGAARLLPTMSEKASAIALESLRSMGVEVRLSTFVTHIDAEGVRLGDEQLPASNVIWAAGVKASSLGATLGVPLDRAGRVVVEPDCSVPGHPQVFVIGDMAAQMDAKTNTPVPGVAQGALQMGDFVAAIVRDGVAGRARPRGAFSYRDKGSLATIGRARAVADVFGTTLGGLTAWLLWSGVHVAFLVGFRNKVFVMLSWAWSYIRNARGARLITGPTPKALRDRDAP
jgi:NADH:ubiquinone reductase (H+-translocating)